MDGFSTMTLEEMGIIIRIDDKSSSAGAIIFDYEGDMLEIGSVVVREFSTLLRSAVYAILLYGVSGWSWLDDTSLTLGLFSEEGGVFFKIAEGDVIIHCRCIDIIKTCREVGEFSIWVNKQISDPLENIIKPKLYFHMPR